MTSIALAANFVAETPKKLKLGTFNTDQVLEVIRKGDLKVAEVTHCVDEDGTLSKMSEPPHLVYRSYGEYFLINGSSVNAKAVVLEVLASDKYSPDFKAGVWLSDSGSLLSKEETDVWCKNLLEEQKLSEHYRGSIGMRLVCAHGCKFHTIGEVFMAILKDHVPEHSQEATLSREAKRLAVQSKPADDVFFRTDNEKVRYRSLDLIFQELSKTETGQAIVAQITEEFGANFPAAKKKIEIDSKAREVSFYGCGSNTSLFLADMVREGCLTIFDNGDLGINYDGYEMTVGVKKGKEAEFLALVEFSGYSDNILKKARAVAAASS